VLIEEVSKAVQSVLDIAAFNHALAREQEADVKLARMQAAATRCITEQFREEL